MEVRLLCYKDPVKEEGLGYNVGQRLEHAHMNMDCKLLLLFHGALLGIPRQLEWYWQHTG